MTALIGDDSLVALAEGMRGHLLSPGSDGYDAARRVFNGMIDRRPALVARCLGPADVQAAVSFARRHDLPVAVRGGGHDVAGHGTCGARSPARSTTCLISTHDPAGMGLLPSARMSGRSGT